MKKTIGTALLTMGIFLLCLPILRAQAITLVATDTYYWGPETNPWVKVIEKFYTRDNDNWFRYDVADVSNSDLYFTSFHVDAPNVTYTGYSGPAGWRFITPEETGLTGFWWECITTPTYNCLSDPNNTIGGGISLVKSFNLYTTMGHGYFDNGGWVDTIGEEVARGTISGPVSVPEPASLILLGSGLIGLVAWRWHRNV